MLTLPAAKLILVGFSLGSNIMINFLGELGERNLSNDSSSNTVNYLKTSLLYHEDSRYFDKEIQSRILGSIALGTPFDMMLINRNMESPLGKFFYSSQMVVGLVQLFKRVAHFYDVHPEIIPQNVVKAKSVREFDELVTRRVFNYRSVDDYYRKAGSENHIANVSVPLICLSSKGFVCFTEFNFIR